MSRAHARTSHAVMAQRHEPHDSLISDGPFAGLPRRGFSVVEADPPWTYAVRSEAGEGRSASRHYRTMAQVDICALPVTELAARDCHLFLWTTGPHLPQALNVMQAWGFRYSTLAFTWIKLRRALAGRPALFCDLSADFHVGMGHTTRKNAEFVLLGRRGNPKRLSKAVRELIVAPVQRHSQKPDEVYQRIEAYAPGPYVRLFARSQRVGWTSWGDEAGDYPGEAVAA